MMKYLVFLLFFYNIVFSLDLTSFDGRQEAVSKIKTMILKEELFSKAYEEYILENYAIPSNTNLVGATTILESNFLSTIDTNLFNSITVQGTTTLSYALKSDLSNDTYLKTLYESNTFRKRTFVVDGKVSFIFDDDFAKLLAYLIKNQTTGVSGIPTCSTLSLTRYCKENNHIYVYDSDLETNLLMYYHKDKFKTGPIIISDDTALYTNKEYSFIPRGAILYDTDGIKYVKTVNSIEQVR